MEHKKDQEKEGEQKYVFEAAEPEGAESLCVGLHEGQLPKFLEEAVRVTDLAHQQDMLLLACLSAASYALPNIKFLHNMGSKEYYPNLMVVVVAPPASGKGTMENANRLIDPIDRFLKMVGMRAKVSASSNEVNFFESLMECGGNGFMLATEINQLSKEFKKDGGYSTLFRQAFEHEAWSRTRYRGGKRIHFELDEPKLSVVLSGTEDQLIPLLEKGENGLASRFLPYIVENVMLFDERVVTHGDRYNENGAKVVFERLAQELFARWNWLRAQEKEHLWSWTEEQAVLFGKLIKEAERLMLDRVGQKPKAEQPELLKALMAMEHRMAVTLERIGLTLSLLRVKVGSELPDVIYCQDIDFATVVSMGEKLFLHAFKLTEKLMEDGPHGVQLLEARADAKERMEELLAKLPQRFQFAKIKCLTEELKITERTLNRYMDELVEAKKIVRLSKGNYKKL